MSSGEESRDSEALKPTKPAKASNPAIWGLAGVLAGSLVSGVFSLATAQKAYDAAENTAARSTLQNERTIEETRRRGQEEFIREQRVAAFNQFLVLSQTAARDQVTVLNVMNSNAQQEVINNYYSISSASYEEFVSIAWTVEFYATEEVETVADKLSAELFARQEMLSTYRSGAVNASEIDAKVRDQEMLRDYRTQFTTVARGLVTS
jgi:hypothetical protein